MAWNNAPKAKDIIGMEADELKQKLDGAATKDDLKAITDAQSATSGTLAAIQASLAKLTTPAPVVPEPINNDDDAVRVLTDPRGLISDATKDVRSQAMETQAQLAEMRARNTYSAAFSQYGEDLMKTAMKYPAEQRAKPNFWDFHIRTVLGDKVVSGDIRAGNFPNLLGPSSGAPGAAAEKDANEGFAPEMASFFKNRGVPLDKARKIYDLTVRDGEPINHANYFGKSANN